MHRYEFLSSALHIKVTIVACSWVIYELQRPEFRILYQYKKSQSPKIQIACLKDWIQCLARNVRLYFRVNNKPGRYEIAVKECFSLKLYTYS